MARTPECCVAVRGGERGPADDESGRQGIGGSGVGGHDGRAADQSRLVPRSRIDDLAVTTAVDQHELPARSAGSERSVAQPDAHGFCRVPCGR